MRHVLSFLVVLCFTVQSWAIGDTWKEIVKDPTLKQTPLKEETFIPIGEARGGYYIELLGDRFAFLFDETGRPVVTFDLTMDQIGTKDQILGAIGIGGFSLRKLFSKYKKSREKSKNLLENEDTLDAFEPEPFTEKDIKEGYKAFAKIHFKDEWIKRNGFEEALKSGRTNGFSPNTFSMSDLVIEKKNENKLYEEMNIYSQIVFQEPLERESLDDFMSQFKMIWDENEKEFTMLWTPQAALRALKKKGPEIPMWVANYANPLDLLAYKAYLRSIEKQTASVDYYLGRPGQILSTFITRVTFSLKNQLDTHEYALLTHMEAAIKNNYTLPFRTNNAEKFIDNTINLVYLNKYYSGDNILDARRKRKEILMDQASARAGVLKWLDKHKYTYEVWPEDRHATVYKNGKRKGIMSLAIRKGIFGPSMHTYERAPWFKLAHRLGLEALVLGIRSMLNDRIISRWISQQIGISFHVTMPNFGWDIIIRGRSWAEIANESHITTMIDERLAERGPAIPGYSDSELEGLKKTVYAQRMNPFEVDYKDEAASKKRNLDLVYKFIGQTPSPEGLTKVPMKMLYPE